MNKDKLQILQNFIRFLSDEIEENEETLLIGNYDDDNETKSFTSEYIENIPNEDLEIYIKVEYDITAIESNYYPSTHDNPSESEINYSYTLYDITYEENNQPMPCPIDINKLERAINNTNLKATNVQTLLKPELLQKNENKSYRHKNKKTVIALTENKLRAFIKNYIKEIIR